MEVRLPATVKEKIVELTRGRPGRFTNKVMGLIRQLEDNPELGRPDPTGLFPGCRMATLIHDAPPIVNRGHVLYKIVGDLVAILDFIVDDLLRDDEVAGDDDADDDYGLFNGTPW